MADASESNWLLLIHHIPPKPGYLRAKIRRRLQCLGAVAIKNSVYVLPRNNQTLEDFQWVLREIVQGGAEASLCEAQFVEGLTNEQVQALFHAARDAEYGQVVQEARSLLESIPLKTSQADERQAEVKAQLIRLKKRFAAITAIDFFGAPGREAVEGSLSSLEDRIKPSQTVPEVKGRPETKLKHLGKLHNRTWVTRKGAYVDRIASAWLIRRFIDSNARFRFVSPKGYRPKPAEIRFDMFEAEFTHEGDRCTFEVLLERVGLEDPALRPIGEIVHDIDLKDGKFRREEAAGLACLIDGIAMGSEDDQKRLARGIAVFDGLYEHFRRKRA